MGSGRKDQLEVQASSVEDAIEEGLNQLGLTRNAVEIEVLDEGKSGFLGLGGREAKVRLTVTNPITLDMPAKKPKPSRQEKTPAAPPLEQKEVPVTEEQPEAEVQEEIPPDAAVDIDVYAETDADDGLTDDEREAMQKTEEVVRDLLDKMHVRAEITITLEEDDDRRGRKCIHVNIEGQDLSILIGRRADTLNALQYVISLIINKQMGRLVPLNVDVQGYRARRERQLDRIAKQMADQAVRTNRRQVLEPMSANERRIIHLALRNHPDVITESIGHDPDRKVTIRPKN